MVPKLQIPRDTALAHQLLAAAVCACGCSYRDFPRGMQSTRCPGRTPQSPLSLHPAGDLGRRALARIERRRPAAPPQNAAGPIRPLSPHQLAGSDSVGNSDSTLCDGSWCSVRQRTASAQHHCSPYITVPTLCHKRRSCLATMRGATPNWVSNANSNPPNIKTIAACAHGACARAYFGLEINKSPRQHATATQVCAANSLAAMKPAKAGEGRCANRRGTTKKPMVVKLPHHRAAIKAGRRWRMPGSWFKGS